MKSNFRLRSGKYQGETYESVCEKNPNYIAWVKENQPNMLKEHKVTVTNVKTEPMGQMVPNPNFENEGPEWYCKPYFKKVKELNKKAEIIWLIE